MFYLIVSKIIINHQKTSLIGRSFKINNLKEPQL